MLDRLIRTLIQLGRHDEALRRANRLAEIEPLREETHRLVISQEAIVSGRACAMQRFEAFRLLLRDELAVKPEAATYRLVEELRQQPAAEVPRVEAEAAAAAGEAQEAILPPIQTMVPHAANRWRPGLAAGVAAALLLSGLIAVEAWRSFATPVARVDNGASRASLVLLPFEIAADLTDLRSETPAYEAETKRVLAHNPRLAILEDPGHPTPPSSDPISLGRALNAPYVVKTVVTEGTGEARADVSVFDTTAGVSIAAAPVLLTEGKSKFARALYRIVYHAIAHRQATVLSALEQDSVPALLWRAAAAEVTRGVTIADPPTVSAYRAVLARDPKQPDALLGLARGLLLKVAHGLSKRDNRTEDLDAAASLLEEAKAQLANPAQVAFLEGLLAKLRFNYEEAIEDFDRARMLDPDNFGAASQAAHVKLLLGRFEQAYAEMEAVPDIPVADSGFIAGETALMAGHLDCALEYFDLAVTANPEIPKEPRLARRGFVAGRPQRGCARSRRESQQGQMPYRPKSIAARAQFANKRYKDARDGFYRDFETLVHAPEN